MKFKKNATYDALFLSDIHYLLNKKVKDHGHSELFQFLKYLDRRGVRFRTVFLVGDIIEAWYFSARRTFKKKKKRFNRLFDRLDAVAAPGAFKYYIVGNHDTTSFTQQLEPSIQRFLDKRHWRVVEEVKTDDMVVLHGHQGQYNKLSWALDILIVRIIFSLAYVIPNLWKVSERFYHKHLNGRDPRSPVEAMEYYERLSRAADQKDRVMISGHTHGFLCIPELKVINTGDWLHSRTFVVRDKDKFIGVRMKKKKEYKKEFELKIKKKRTVIPENQLFLEYPHE